MADLVSRSRQVEMKYKKVSVQSQEVETWKTEIGDEGLIAIVCTWTAWKDA